MSKISLKQTRERMVELMNSNVRIQGLEWDDMHNIIDALDKQIPVIPDTEGDGLDSSGSIILDTWICPTCRNYYEIDYEKHGSCPKCGQAIDWSWEDA